MVTSNDARFNDLKYLEKLYVKRKYNSYNIARIFNCTPEYVREKLKEYGIWEKRKFHGDGRKVSAEGYVSVRIDHGVWVPEHRYIWEQEYGHIPKGLLIHHLNGKKDDNRLENLVAISREKHGIDNLLPAYSKRVNDLEKEVKELEELLIGK